MAKKTTPLTLDNLMDEIEDNVFNPPVEDQDNFEDDTSNEDDSDEDSEEDNLEEEDDDKNPKNEDAPEDIDDEDFVTPLAEEVHNKLGFDFEFDKKDFKEAFGDGVDGLTNFISEVIKQNSTPQFENEVAAKYYEYLSKGGDPEKLSSIIEAKTNFSNIKTEEVKEDVQLQKTVYTQYLKLTNPDRDAKWIQAKVDRADNSGILEDEAVDAVDSVVSHYKKLETETLESIKRKEQEDKAAIDNFWKMEEAEIAKAEELAGVKLNNTTKAKFTDYYKSGKFNEAVKDPNVLRQLAFINFIGIDKFKTTINSKNADDLISKIKRHTSSNMSMGGKDRRPETTTITDIRDLEI